MRCYFVRWASSTAAARVPKLVPRPPIVTIMGHVDHGKTTMLDSLRKSSVAAGEAGGITQHIGAFQVSLKSSGQDRLITFIDTPGHAAFSKIRQRGAKVTDLIVLVVAAEDGVMPQTEEVISISKATATPMIVAMNKWDKIASIGGPESAEVRKLKDSLARLGVELEEYGGSVQCIPVSAVTGYNMDILQEAIIAEAEMMELMADPEGPLEATVIESKTLTGLGPVATAIVHQGTIHQGMYVASENAYCKIRALRDASGQAIKHAGPSCPVEIVGWKNSQYPIIGSKLARFSSEAECKSFVSTIERIEEIDAVRDAQKAAKSREQLDKQLLKLRRERSKDLSLKPIHVLDYEQVAKASKVETLDVVLHTDVTGTQEALIQAISALPQTKVKVNVVAAELGSPTESSIDLLDTCTNPSMIVFNCPLSKQLQKLAQERGIRIIHENVIYHLLDRLQEQMADLLPPIETTSVLGTAKVLQLFAFGKETVIGCRIDDGLFTRQVPSSNQGINKSEARPAEIIFAIERKGKQMWRGPIKSLKHLKKDIAQAQKGIECGIILEGVDESIIQPEDTIKCLKLSYTRQSIK